MPSGHTEHSSRIHPSRTLPPHGPEFLEAADPDRELHLRVFGRAFISADRWPEGQQIMAGVMQSAVPTTRPKAPIGVYLVSALCAMAALSCGTASLLDHELAGRRLSLLLGVMFMVLCVGIALRSNASRLGLMAILAFGFLRNGAALFSAAGWQAVAPRVIVGMAVAACTIWYLCRPEVQAAFRVGSARRV